MTTARVLTDGEAIAGVLGGDADVFGVLVERYQKAILNYIVRMLGDYEEALDLSQEVFLKAYQNLASFDSQYKFSTWLYKIASNHTIDHIRKRKGSTVSIDEPEEEGRTPLQLRDTQALPDEQLDKKRMLEKVQRAVAGLEDDYRELLILRHVNWRSYEEIAKITGLPLGTVKNRIFRARVILKKAVES